MTLFILKWLISLFKKKVYNREYFGLKFEIIFKKVNNPTRSQYDDFFFLFLFFRFFNQYFLISSYRTHSA